MRLRNEWVVSLNLYSLAGKCNNFCWREMSLSSSYPAVAPAGGHLHHAGVVRQKLQKVGHVYDAVPSDILENFAAHLDGQR